MFALVLGTARLKEFAEELRSVIMSIIPSKTPINLVFDGVVEESADESAATLSGYRLGQVPLEVSDENRFHWPHIPHLKCIY